MGKLNENNGEVVQRQVADARRLPRLLGPPSCGLGEAGLEVGLGRVGGSRPQGDVLRAPLLWEPRGGMVLEDGVDQPCAEYDSIFRAACAAEDAPMEYARISQIAETGDKLLRDGCSCSRRRDSSDSMVFRSS